MRSPDRFFILQYWTEIWRILLRFFFSVKAIRNGGRETDSYTAHQRSRKDREKRMAVDCSPDFFIYVPTTHDAETPSRINQEEGEEVASSNPLALAQDEWVKIPLEGELIIYARLRDDQLEQL